MADASYQPKVYKKQGGDDLVVASGGTLDIESGGAIEIAGTAITSTAAELNIMDGVTATAAELNAAADVSAGKFQELTVSGAITAGVQNVELNHATVIVASTIADLANHVGILQIKDTSASGTAAHTCTATAGTFDGTNDIATFNAPDESLHCMIDSNGKGIIITNTGSVAMSSS